MAHPWRSEEERAECYEKQEVIADCSKCVSEEVCKYRHDYECPHFKNKAGYVEMKHGEWLRNEPNPEQMKEFRDMGIGKAMAISSIYWTCSCCGTWGTPRYKYCPNCGAKMDGGKK